ncbi:hypothetical protein N9Q15_02280 [Amylibacter sp.]|nr:hypothetical protein [Amylibacter sp.]
MDKLDTTDGTKWNVIDEHDLERISNHEGIKSHEDLLWDVTVDNKIDKNFCYGLLLKYKDYNWRIVIFPEEYKPRTETAKLLDFITVDFIENFKRDEYYADCRKFSETFDHSYNDDLETKSKRLKFSGYNCEIDSDHDRGWYGDYADPEARIVDKTIFIKDNNSNFWYSGKLLDEPKDNFIPSEPYKKLLDFIAYNRELTIKDIKSHIDYKLSDYNSIVKKYEKNVSVKAIVTACKNLDDEYKTAGINFNKIDKNFLELISNKEYINPTDITETLTLTPEQAKIIYLNFKDGRYNLNEIQTIRNMNLTSDPRFKKYISISVKGYEFQEEITSKLDELWNLLEYIIYFKYFDEIYENGFSRSPKVLFSKKSDMSHLKLQLNKHQFYQNKNTNSIIYGFDYNDTNRHLFEICKKLIVGPDWCFKDFFLDDMNDDFDDGWSYPNSYEESSDDEKDTLF